jgi:RNA polymerase sigma-70 factor (ECF subfamily)
MKTDVPAIPGRLNPARLWRVDVGESGGGGRLDEASIREFLAGDYSRIVAGVALVAGSRPAAEDAVQEALARAWERSLRGESIDRLEAWVTTVAMNLARSRLRRIRAEWRARGRLEVSAAPTLGPERADLRRALESLPRRQREVTVLHYYLDLDVAEVARTLGVSAGAVKASLHLARRALARSLREPEDEEEANVVPN